MCWKLLSRSDVCLMTQARRRQAHLAAAEPKHADDSQLLPMRVLTLANSGIDYRAGAAAAGAAGGGGSEANGRQQAAALRVLRWAGPQPPHLPRAEGAQELLEVNKAGFAQGAKESTEVAKAGCAKQNCPEAGHFRLPSQPGHKRRTCPVLKVSSPSCHLCGWQMLAFASA